MESRNTHNLRSGVLYRNPKPHVFSKQAYFPSVVVLNSKELLASFVIGQAFEAADSDVYLSRSNDMGESWSAPVRLLKEPKNALVSNFARIAGMANNSVVAMVVNSHREMHPEDGLANPETLGFVPTDLGIVRSKDSGRTWDGSQVITPPLVGPSFELCSPIVQLSGGRWLWPTSTWRGWDGYCPNGMKMIGLVSDDRGSTWPGYFDIMDRSDEGIIFWEGKVIELSKGILLAVAWAYDEKKGKDLQNQYTISRDGGKTWMTPASTDVFGQTMSIAALSDGKVLAVYRRMDKPGLWMNLVRIEGDAWVNEKDIPLWRGQDQIETSKSTNMVTDFNELKFGAPCITLLPDKSIYITFWCYEKMVSNIRWFKFTL